MPFRNPRVVQKASRVVCLGAMNTQEKGMGGSQGLLGEGREKNNRKRNYGHRCTLLFPPQGEVKLGQDLGAPSVSKSRGLGQ